MAVAVVAGGTGLTGSALIQKLLSDSDISKVISISRNSLLSFNSKLIEVIVSDLSQLLAESARLSGDFYFCCLGSTLKAAGSQENFEKIDFSAVVAFAQIAKSHHAKSFSLVSASGANARSRIFYSRVKGKTEQAILNLKFSRLNIFRPGLLLGNRRQVRRGEKFAINLVRALSLCLPSFITHRIATDVSRLAIRLLAEAKKSEPGIFIFEASEI